MEKDEVNRLSEKDSDKRFKVKAGIFLAGVSGVSALIGFGTTLASVKKRDPNCFDQGLTKVAVGVDNGAQLAMRALGYGTIIAFTGCGILFYGIWKLSGATSLADFRQRVGSVLPRLTPKEQNSRTEFSGLNDLLSYVSSEKYQKSD